MDMIPVLGEASGGRRSATLDVSSEIKDNGCSSPVSFGVAPTNVAAIRISLETRDYAA